MKEAAGEANMTVVTIILIAAIVAVVTPIVMSTVANMGKQTCCQNHGYIYKGSKCLEVTSDGSVGTEDKLDDVWDSSAKECK